MKQTILLVAVLGGLVLATGWVAFDVWSSMETQMGWHGWLALALGVAFTAALGAGLMWLVFYSSSHGHDDIDDFR